MKSKTATLPVWILFGALLFFTVAASADYALPDFSEYTRNRAERSDVRKETAYTSVTWIIPAGLSEGIAEEYAALLENEYGLSVLDRSENEKNDGFTVCYSAKDVDRPGLRIQAGNQWLKGCHVILMLRHAPDQGKEMTVTLIFTDGFSLASHSFRSMLLPSPPPRPSPAPTAEFMPSPAPTATGIGGWEWVETEKDCFICGGSGKCRICHGMGYTSMYGQRIECDPSCSSCGGSGKIKQREYRYVIH